jgi:hypothetical protein
VDVEAGHEAGGAVVANSEEGLEGLLLYSMNVSWRQADPHDCARNLDIQLTFIEYNRSPSRPSSELAKLTPRMKT